MTLTRGPNWSTVNSESRRRGYSASKEVQMAGLYEFAGFMNNYGVGAVLVLLMAVLVVHMVQPIFER